MAGKSPRCCRPSATGGATGSVPPAPQVHASPTRLSAAAFFAAQEIVAGAARATCWIGRNRLPRRGARPRWNPFPAKGAAVDGWCGRIGLRCDVIVIHVEEIDAADRGCTVCFSEDRTRPALVGLWERKKGQAGRQVSALWPPSVPLAATDAMSIWFGSDNPSVRNILINLDRSSSDHLSGRSQQFQCPVAPLGDGALLIGKRGDMQGQRYRAAPGTEIAQSSLVAIVSIVGIAEKRAVLSTREAEEQIGQIRSRRALNCGCGAFARCRPPQGIAPTGVKRTPRDQERHRCCGR